MAQISVDLLKRLREMTGAGMMDCRRALEESAGDLDRAAALLRERGIARAADRAGRETANGVVEAYLHRTSDDYPPQLGALIEVGCESDFVAKSEDFRRLARELAMQVAAAKPRWVSRDEVPTEVLEEKRSQLLRAAEQDGRSPKEAAAAMESQLEAFFRETCLLEQPWIRDPQVPVRDLIAQTGSRVQENITVRRFSRFSIKEG